MLCNAFCVCQPHYAHPTKNKMRKSGLASVCGEFLSHFGVVWEPRAANNDRFVIVNTFEHENSDSMRFSLAKQFICYHIIRRHYSPPKIRLNQPLSHWKIECNGLYDNEISQLLTRSNINISRENCRCLVCQCDIFIVVDSPNWPYKVVKCIRAGLTASFSHNFFFFFSFPQNLRG